MNKKPQVNPHTRFCNSGNCNSGNWNSGDWNSGNQSSGDFNITNKYTNFYEEGDE